MYKFIAKNITFCISFGVFLLCAAASIFINSKITHVKPLANIDFPSQKPINSLFADLNKPKNSTIYYNKDLFIFTYHYVEYVQDKKDTLRKSLNIEPHTFEEHLILILNKGYQPIYVKNINAILENKNDNKKYVALTFDDGYRDFYEQAFPLLKKYNVKATLFVVPSFLNKKDYLTFNQLQEISDSNLVEIASHTMSHQDLTNPKSINTKYEIEESKKYLEKILNKKVYTFSYPYGRYNKDLINQVITSGYTSAVSTDNGYKQSGNNLFSLQRIRAGGLTYFIK